MRWVQFLEQYKLEYVYHPGREAAVPDFLSRIATIVVEAGRVARMACAQYSDLLLACFFTRAHGVDPTFHLCGGGDTPVLYRVAHGHEHLVMPATGGFRQLVLSELHDSKLGRHLDATRTLAALTQWVWWPRMRSDVKAYVASCATCQQIKDHTQWKLGLL